MTRTALVKLIKAELKAYGFMSKPVVAEITRNLAKRIVETEANIRRAEELLK